MDPGEACLRPPLEYVHLLVTGCSCHRQIWRIRKQSLFSTFEIIFSLCQFSPLKNEQINRGSRGSDQKVFDEN